jgi:hypothetical protein
MRTHVTAGPGFIVAEKQLDFRAKVSVEDGMADRVGWEVRQLPRMTILHHAGKAGSNERMSAQDAFAARQGSRQPPCGDPPAQALIPRPDSTFVEPPDHPAPHGQRLVHGGESTHG